MKNTLLVPAVFFLNFFCVLLLFAFFGGLALRYQLTVPEAQAASFLLLCIAERGCYTLPAAAVIAIIAVYIFLMRNRTRLFIAITFFIISMLITIIVIIPVCYAQLPYINELMTQYTATPSTDTVVFGFIRTPTSLMHLSRDTDILFKTIYDTYLSSFKEYLLFISCFFLCISSLWGLCIASQWRMINVLLLFIFVRIFFFLYPYIQQDFFQSLLYNMRLDSENCSFGIPIVLGSIALLFHCLSGVKLLFYIKRHKERRTA